MSRMLLIGGLSALLVLCIAVAAASPALRPWYPRLQNLLFPPDLAGAVLDAGVRFDRLVVDKSKRRLTAYAQGRPVKMYFVALGKVPVGHKQFEGDLKVPEGTYTIYDKNPYSNYHKNLGISYPNEDDRAFAESQGREPGGQIKIHGLGPRHVKRGRLHWLKDWSAGCIIVTDAEMDEIYERTPVGTPIMINP